jgi:hypothetical protein
MDPPPPPGQPIPKASLFGSKAPHNEPISKVSLFMDSPQQPSLSRCDVLATIIVVWVPTFIISCAVPIVGVMFALSINSEYRQAARACAAAAILGVCGYVALAVVLTSL